MAASPSSGVNTITGEGLAEALAGAQVVVDVANSPSFEDKAVLEFFETAGRNLLAAEAAAGVGHHVALSVVGTDRLPESGYFRAKMAQENLIKASEIPYTIVRSTQFFEFIGGIAKSGTDGQTDPPVARASAAHRVGRRRGRTGRHRGRTAGERHGRGGRSRARFRSTSSSDEFLAANGDKRQVIADVHARYFGAELNDQIADARRSPAHRPDTFRRLAQPFLARN